MAQFIGGRAQIRFGEPLHRWIHMYAEVNDVTYNHAVRAIVLQFAKAYARAQGRGDDRPDTIHDWRVVGDVIASSLPRRAGAAAGSDPDGATPADAA